MGEQSTFSFNLNRLLLLLVCGGAFCLVFASVFRQLWFRKELSYSQTQEEICLFSPPEEHSKSVRMCWAPGWELFSGFPWGLGLGNTKSCSVLG